MNYKEKLTEKQKKVLVLLTAGFFIYLTFRFLLPILFPFLVSLFIAILFEPAVRWINEKTRIKKEAAAFVLQLLAGAVLGLLCFLVIKKLLDQIGNLIANLPEYERWLYDCLMKLSTYCENWFHVEKSQVFEELLGFLIKGINSVKDRIMPWLIDNSGGLFTGFVGVTTIFVLIQVAVVLCTKELDNIRRISHESIFAREIELVKKPIVSVGRAYLKTQVIILAIVISELIFGFSIMGNKYSYILGILIGILDALPIFGTGTVLIPWILIELVMGNFLKMFEVLALYLSCYFTRQFLEPKLMGDGTGLSPLETMIAFYVGLRLFGIWGLFTGPIAWLLVKEFVRAYS